MTGLSTQIEAATANMQRPLAHQITAMSRGRPIGAFNSPNYHDVVLFNWAKARKISIGKPGWAGKALFVAIRPSVGFCIEDRGPGACEPRMHFPFDPANREQRREQFARARICFEGGYILGDYPGKVSLWERLGGKLKVPSFGECLRQVISGGKKFGDDHTELDASFTWQALRHRQQVSRFCKPRRPPMTNPPVDEVKRIAELLSERDAYLAQLGGCSDGYCIVHKPKGMHTNGGCRCNTDKYLMTRYAYANNKFADAVRDHLTGDDNAK